MVEVCVMFCEHAAPGRMGRHADGMRLVLLMLGDLRSGDAVLAHLPEFEDTMEERHETYMALQPLCRRPKLHLNWHVPECIRMRGCNLSCHAGERNL